MIKPKKFEECKGMNKESVEVWGDSAGWYCFAKLDGGYALVDSDYECLSVFRDNPDEEICMSDDMEFSANFDDIVENHAEWVDLYKSMAEFLMMEYKTWTGYELEWDAMKSPRW